jgi:hypothetical protein
MRKVMHKGKANGRVGMRNADIAMMKCGCDFVIELSRPCVIYCLVVTTR